MFWPRDELLSFHAGIATGDAIVLHKFTCAAGLLTMIASVAGAITVAVPEKSQPESITVAPNGDLILGSMGSAIIYRAKKGSGNSEVFVDVSADGAGFFLGVLADALTNTLWACQIYTTPARQRSPQRVVRLRSQDWRRQVSLGTARRQESVQRLRGWAGHGVVH